MATDEVDNQHPDKDAPLEVQPWKFYTNDYRNTYKIVEKKWGTFCLVGGVIYMYHLCWTIAGVNAYADHTRMIACGTITEVNLEAME